MLSLFNMNANEELYKIKVFPQITRAVVNFFFLSGKLNTYVTYFDDKNHVSSIYFDNGDANCNSKLKLH